jgi:hypothetical protein
MVVPEPHHQEIPTMRTGNVDSGIKRTTRAGILKQSAKSRYSEILGFEVRRNSRIFYFLMVAT